MEWIFYFALFFISCGLLYWAGEIIINHLIKLSRLLGLAQFVIAFLVVAFAASLPNLFVGISSALRGVPELSLGDVFGNNLISMTLAITAAIFFSAGKSIPAEGKTIQTTVVAVAIFSTLPLILMTDGELSRLDGLILIGAFLIYLIWLFSSKDRFKRTPDPEAKLEPLGKTLKKSFHSLILVIVGMAGLVLAAQGIITSAEFFALSLGMSLVLVGLLIVGLGNALPQVYFAIASARKGETSIILGNLMGAIIFPATLVLGIVALINPVDVSNLNLFSISRFYLILAALTFLIFIKTQQRIDHWEGWILFLIYLAFLITIFLV